MSALLNLLEWAIYRLRRRLNYPTPRFICCRACGGRTAMLAEGQRR